MIKAFLRAGEFRERFWQVSNPGVAVNQWPSKPSLGLAQYNEIFKPFHS